MKRLLLCAAVALAAGLVLAPAALASVGAHHSDVSAAPLGLASHARAFAPLDDTGPYNISGKALDFGGSGVAGAEVDWASGPIRAATTSATTTTRPTRRARSTSRPSRVGTRSTACRATSSTSTTIRRSPASRGSSTGRSTSQTSNDTTPYSYDMRPGRREHDPHRRAGDGAGRGAGRQRQRGLRASRCTAHRRTPAAASTLPLSTSTT